MRSFLSNSVNVIAFVAILYASYLLILLSLPYTAFEKNIDFLKTKQLIYHIDVWRVSFYIHVFTSPIVILSGLFQFNRRILHRFPQFHRWTGITYVSVIVLISGPAAMVMSFYANGGYISQVSFVMLSAFWIITTLMAFLKAKKSDFESHIRWNIRSYALTLSAVTLRFYAYMFDVFKFQLPPKETYILLSYLSWIPNLIFAEIFIRLGYVKYLLKKP